MDNLAWLLLGLILGVPFSIFANFATPWVKSYYKRQSLSIRDRRIYIVVGRYREVEDMKKNPAYFNQVTAKNIYMLFSFTILLMAFAFLSMHAYIVDNDSVRGWVAGGFFLAATLIVSQIADVMRKDVEDVQNFDHFRDRTLAKLKKIGGTPKDLDAGDDS